MQARHAVACQAASAGSMVLVQPGLTFSSVHADNRIEGGPSLLPYWEPVLSQAVTT